MSGKHLASLGNYANLAAANLTERALRHTQETPSPLLLSVQWNHASDDTGLEVRHGSHGGTQPLTSPSAWDSMIPFIKNK